MRCVLKEFGVGAASPCTDAAGTPPPPARLLGPYPPAAQDLLPRREPSSLWGR
jgi:hypothetical protein